MKVRIDSVGRAPTISQLISVGNGPMLNAKQVEILEFCQVMSVETWTGFIDGNLICCWGLIPPSALSNQAYLWMHSTPEIRKHAFVIVRHSQRVIEEMLKRYPKIVGDCLASAEDSIRWLGWLGAEFGPVRGPCLPFTIRRK